MPHCAKGMVGPTIVTSHVRCRQVCYPQGGTGQSTGGSQVEMASMLRSSPRSALRCRAATKSSQPVLTTVVVENKAASVASPVSLEPVASPNGISVEPPAVAASNGVLKPHPAPSNGTLKPQVAQVPKKEHPFTVLQEVRGFGVMDVSNVLVRGGAAGAPADIVQPTQQGQPAADLAPVHPPLQARILVALEGLFLPDGWDHTPSSITKDYIPYQLMTLPTHALGNLAHALTTSSLLQAVGVNAGPAATTAASAAIKWITKEGIGALGRFVVGGSLSSQFDRDPRRWRMVAEAFTALGAGLEIATAAFPQHFLLLASTGQFSRALGKSIGKPVFRIIQTHFARDNNVGAVAAKEEVWEVCAQILGYAVSLGVLSAVDAFIVQKGSSNGTELVAIWAVVQSSHMVLRYNSLRTLVFEILNEKRARILVADHVAGRPLRDPSAVNRAEPLLLPPEACMQPLVHIGAVGVTEWLEKASVLAPSDDGSIQPTADALLQLYQNEHHLLLWDPHSQEAHVVLREDAPPQTVLRVLYQAHWLHHYQHQHMQNQLAGQSYPGAPTIQHIQGTTRLEGVQLLAASVQALHLNFPAFAEEAQRLGWELDSAVLMATGAVRFRTV